MANKSDWDKLTITQRYDMLTKAQYKQSTVEKFAPMPWSKIDATTKTVFRRIVAIYYAEHNLDASTSSLTKRELEILNG